MIRELDYLRISITDRCNLGCVYCMPRNGIVHRYHDELLTFEEILGLARIFVSLGVKRIRLTGGEPLIRKGVLELIRGLVALEGVEEVLLTTNGILLSDYAKELKKAGLKRINVSLDTLKEDRFEKITRGGSLNDVLQGIRAAKDAGFRTLKLNMVVMKGINEDEVIDFADFAFSEGLVLRFIEFMKVTPLWKADQVIPIEEVREICQKKFNLKRTENPDSGPAVYYRSENGPLLGFIKTDEYNCSSCTRLRLASTGELKICLYETQGLRLKKLLEKGVYDSEIKDIIKARLEMKQSVDYRNWECSKVYMSSVGG